MKIYIFESETMKNVLGISENYVLDDFFQFVRIIVYFTYEWHSAGIFTYLASS